MEQARNISNKNDEDIIAVAHKLSEYNCMSVKQHRFLIKKRLN